MKTQPASLPAAPPATDLLLSDEVVFRHRNSEDAVTEVQMPLAVGLLYAANALRAGEDFALGYPGDRIGRIARCEHGGSTVHRDVAGTLEGMVTFLSAYADALSAQAQLEVAEALQVAQSTQAAQPSPDPGENGNETENFSPAAA